MAKRFTDTDKWKKSFIRSLPVEYKLFWLYLLDDCDFAGIWHVDFEVAELRIGLPLIRKTAEELFEGRIVIFDDDDKWFIPDFLEFQYGTLKEENRMHKGVLAQLHKYNLMGLQSPFNGAKEKEQDKDKDKEQDKEQETVPFETFWNLYDKKTGRQECEKEWRKLKNRDKERIINAVPFYIHDTQDKKFRKDPIRFLRKRVWEDEAYDSNVVQMGSKKNFVSQQDEAVNQW